MRTTLAKINTIFLGTTPKPPAKKVPVVKSWAVDLNLDENRAAHNTLSYDQRDLITRRGGKFRLTVTIESGVQGG